MNWLDYDLNKAHCAEMIAIAQENVILDRVDTTPRRLLLAALGRTLIAWGTVLQERYATTRPQGIVRKVNEEWITQA
jgi:hypothetical protein